MLGPFRSLFGCRHFCGMSGAITALALSGNAKAADDPEVHGKFRSVRLKRMPLEQLVDVEIYSVSRRPSPLSLAPSAIDVLRSNDIRRAGATNVPDALRLATGLHVAQIDGHTWAISSRGFNTSASNKLQVLMDGRSLYTPLFSGVFWDVQHTFLPDLEQIEVIRGPGATLWGANAVNGVINIRTKSAKETQGILLHGGGGNEERGFGGVRYGGTVGKTAYRVYATHLNRDSLTLEQGGLDAQDEFALTQGGFRMDSELTQSDLLTIQGDLYEGKFGQLNAGDVDASGGNGIVRWTRQINATSSLMLQTYYDRTHRLIPGVFSENRDTYDAELQHRFAWKNTQVVWGLNYRASHDELGNLGRVLAFKPDRETLHLVSGYLQDEFQLIPDRLTVTVGSKFEHNSFSDFEIQPTARFALQAAHAQTIWGAISRAVRTPTRIDQDLTLPNPAFGSAPALITNRGFESEVLIAYELGYRVKPVGNLSLDLALFYHDYDRLRSQEPTGPDGGRPLLLRNGLDGESYGAELTLRWQPAAWWQLNVGYTLMETELRRGSGSHDPVNGRGEGNDPNHILVARSSIDLPGRMEFDSILRWVSELPDPAVPAYVTLDLRLGWEPRPGLEVAIVGRNLLDEFHPEARATTGTRELSRSVFGTLTWRF